MRILASNPDTIGDMVLRQPLYRALIGAGHELMLIVRRPVEPIARLIAPEAKVLVLPREVYGPVDDGWADFEPLVAAARDGSPELLLIAPYQWTRFEERLAAALRDLPGLQVVGMSGRLYGGDPFAGKPPATSLQPDAVLRVDEDVPEADKNALLADMLGAPVPSVNPVLTPDESSLGQARQILAERGLEPGGYWIACVTGTANVPIKAWPDQRWAQVLRSWHERYERRFLFVGLPSERTVVDQVIAGMGDAGSAAAVWMEEGGSITTLVALASLSRGYAGHDTGPMHIAAATGKPVLAVFGGGHKLRFTPRVTPSVVLSVRVPCAGCGWACSFAVAHCVDALRVIDVIRAAEDLELGRILGQDIRLLPLPADVHDGMTAFAANLARDRLRTLSDVQRQLDAFDPGQASRLQAALDIQTDHANSLSQQLESAAEENRRIHSRTLALSDEAAGLQRQLLDREQAVVELRQLAEAADRAAAAEAAARKSEIESLSREIETLRSRIAALELSGPRVALRPRKSWRERFIDLVCGTRHYEPKSVPRPMPRIRLVTRILDAEPDDQVRQTVDSVLAEQYPHLEYVLTAQDVDRPVVRDYANRVARVMPLGSRPFEAAAEAFAGTDADLVAWLYVGQVYEPGALYRIGEFFRDHSLAMAVAFEQTTDDGWRSPAVRPALSVEPLRTSTTDITPAAHVVFRREACTLLGPLNPARGTAAGWDLIIRFARRFGIRQGQGHSICNVHAVAPWPTGSEADDFKAAVEAFEATFGLPGRVRSAVLHAIGRLRGRRHGRSGQPIGRGWLFEDRDRAVYGGVRAASSSDSLASPISPVARRRPDWLLLSTTDVAGEDGALYRVYYDRTDDAAIAFPPVDYDTISRLWEGRRAIARSEVRPPSNGAISPFRQFKDGPRWARLIATLPTPYWRLVRSKAGATSSIGRLLGLVGQGVAQDPDIRALVVGCFDGGDLDALKAGTRWTLTGLETNVDAAARAEALGHRVFRCSAQDAFMSLPDGEIFDLVYVPAMLEHWDDPAWVLRRLTRLLTPNGRIIVRTPNLDSMLLRRFGPTWWHWQQPHHRVLLGRRGLRRLAASVDLKVERLKTITDAYTAAASVQLNALGLAGVVPEGATFDKRIARRGAKWAGWSRTLWDRWGRGDEMWAVLRSL